MGLIARRCVVRIASSSGVSRRWASKIQAGEMLVSNSLVLLSKI
jgi:hypothetical protein